MSSEISTSDALAAADVARGAARLVARPGGWCQGDFTNRLGAVCAWEAVGQAEPNDVHARMRVYEEGARRIGAGEFLSHIGKWNDDPSRQQSEVVELFESIAKHFDRLASKVDR